MQSKDTDRESYQYVPDLLNFFRNFKSFIVV